MRTHELRMDFTFLNGPEYHSSVVMNTLLCYGKVTGNSVSYTHQFHGHTAANSHAHTVFGRFPATMATETVGYKLEIFPSGLFAGKAANPCSSPQYLHYKYQQKCHLKSPLVSNHVLPGMSPQSLLG